MNRQERRKQEKLFKKLGISTNRGTELVSMGYWYRNDKPEGLGIGATKGKDGYVFDLLEEIHKVSGEEVETLIAQSKWDKDFDLNQLIKETMSVLNQSITMIKSFKDKEELTIEDQYIGYYTFVRSVKILLKFGFLEQDEYNGDKYSYK